MSEEQGAYATRWVADEYGLTVDMDSAEWFDARHESGAKYEVKSTHRELGDGSEGRFRLWEDQHRSLVASDRAGVAWYVFVLFRSSGEVVEFRRAKPSTVTRIVRESGGWNHAGHRERSGRQKKVPWSDVL